MDIGETNENIKYVTLKFHGRIKIMKILYFSDKYAWDVMGTKRSIFEEVKRQGNEIVFYDKKHIHIILQIISQMKPDQIWFSHSALTIPEALKKKIKIPIIGFGFSDPYYFHESRFKSYDVYVTNHYETLEKYKDVLPMHYNPTACDFNFHGRKDLDVKDKDIDISVIGVGIHPRFIHDQERLVIVDMLRRNKPVKFNINCYGKKWNKHPQNFNFIGGEKFLDVIRRSHIGLDIQDDWSPLAHRMFEYISCGTPVITRQRSEVERVFIPGKEIITYKHYGDLCEKLEYYMTDGYDELRKIAEAGYQRCIAEHDIIHRVSSLLSFTESVKDVK